MASNHDSFISSGGQTKDVANFENCLRPSILPGKGKAADAINCTPLHVFLGLADQALSIVESEAACLDELIKEANGEGTDELKCLLLIRYEADSSLAAAISKAETAQAATAEKKAAAIVNDFVKENAQFF